MWLTTIRRSRGITLFRQKVSTKDTLWEVRRGPGRRRYEESARTDKWDTARDLLKTREGAIAAGANASINLELANLKRIYMLAMQAGKVLQRPHVPMLKYDNVRTGFFERAQFEGVRARLKPPLAQAVTLAYYTGWRVPGKVLTLEWHQVDRKACVIRLEPGTTKNRDGRMFPDGELTEVREATRKLQALATATGTITGTIGDHRPTGPLIRVRKSRGVSRLAGDRGGDRTRDPRIKSAMLYH